MNPTACVPRWPTEHDAVAVAQALTGTTPASIRRFPTGLAHWVYDVRAPDDSAIVVRMGTAAQRDDFDGAMHWSRMLRPLGVPLPALLDHGDYRGFPYLVLQRLEGEDLGQVYSDLTVAERKAVAEEVCRIQRRVGTLPPGDGYGFIRLPGDPAHDSWGGVVGASLARSRRRTGLASEHAVDRVEVQAAKYSAYFSRVRATPFLDDATTKNVLVHAGRLSGIVDVDWLCFGDPLFTVALTRTSILSAGHDTDYTDHWCDLLGLTDEQRQIVRFYTALFCVDFMSEFGQRFNRDVEPPDVERLARLDQILDEHLASI